MVTDLTSLPRYFRQVLSLILSYSVSLAPKSFVALKLWH